MPRRLKVYACASLPPGIPLKRPIMTAAPNLPAAARALRISEYHLARHPFPLGQQDVERALQHPGQRLVAGGP